MILNALRAIEACYAVADDDRAWARELLAALAPLGRQAGIHAVRFARGPGSAWEGELLASSAAHSGHPFGTWLREALPRAGGCEVLRAATRAVELLSHGLATAPRSRARVLRALLRSAGAEDVLVVRGDAAGVALVIAAPLASAGAIPARTIWQLGRLAEHLSSALRLRRCLALAALAGSRAAEPTPRGGTLAAAVQREARRSGRPAAPHETEALWGELMNGRWSIIDNFHDADTVALLLRRAQGHDPRALTPRERDVLSYASQGLSNKEIGYALSIGSTTVATHLGIAEEKLGRLTRQGLIAALGASAR